MKLRLFGDIHGNTDYWKKNLKSGIPNIVLGDVGVGFNKNIDVNIPTAQENAWFIRGNHDNPEKCQIYLNYLGDYGYHEGWNLFYIGGAWSIDQEHRIPFVSWWPNEELTFNQMEDCLELYKNIKPRYVISHECPSEVSKSLYGSRHINTFTGTFLDILISTHEPEFWYFGHHHASFKGKVGNTLFQCIDVKEFIDICVEK
jgi:Calcineurin-like phosphoesterase